MKQETVPFSGYQKWVIFLLAVTQFTVILDFMVMSPLGDILMKSLQLKPAAFGIAVSAYAFSAGISGLLTAGFADKFDRKKLLLFFYTGFIIGTICCGLAHTYVQLVAARIVTGLFGGVIGAISMAIVTDLFDLNQRGRVMGFVQMGFGASQVLGVPIGLYFAGFWGWEAPFLMVAALAVVIALLILWKLRPVNLHLQFNTERSVLKHLWSTVIQKKHRIAFTSTALLSIGGFMMMPFGSAFAVNNLQVTNEELPLIFMVSGISSLLLMPIIGRLSDRVSKFKLFMYASLWLMTMCVVYTNLGPTSLGWVIFWNVLMMMGIMSRMVPSSALTSAVPDSTDRGAFMSVNASLQQMAGGLAAAVAGMIVVQEHTYSPLQNYNMVGYVVVGISLISILLMARVNRVVLAKQKNSLSAVSPISSNVED